MSCFRRSGHICAVTVYLDGLKYRNYYNVFPDTNSIDAMIVVVFCYATYMCYVVSALRPPEFTQQVSQGLV